MTLCGTLKIQTITLFRRCWWKKLLRIWKGKVNLKSTVQESRLNKGMSSQKYFIPTCVCVWSFSLFYVTFPTLPNRPSVFCMYNCVHVPVCPYMHAQTRQRSPLATFLLTHAAILFFEVEPVACWVDCFPLLDHCSTAMPGFLCGCWDPHTHPHACGRYPWSHLPSPRWTLWRCFHCTNMLTYKCLIIW